jgi:hypothetical protein
MGAVIKLEHHMERLPVPERPMFRLLQGHETIEEFDIVKSLVARKGHMFWGVEKENPLIPRPHTDETRLDHLNAVYTRIESIDPNTRNWRKKTTPKKAESILDREVKLPKHLKVDEFEEPITAIQLFDHSGINNMFLNDLSEEGNPQFIVVRAFENWRSEYNTVIKASETDTAEELVHDEEILDIETLEKTTRKPVTQENLERGYRAFEQFLFGVDSTNFLKKLKAVSIEYLSVKEPM